MNAGQPLLEIRDLECVRDGRVLFSALNLRLDAGELISLQGANGAGKSTLLRCIAGLYPDYEGSLKVTPLVYAGHKAGLSGALSTVENLQFLTGLDNSSAPNPDTSDPSGDVPKRDKPRSLAQALAEVGLAGYEDVRCAALSAGQLRRVGIARLLLSPAALWLLDEPLTALDQAAIDLLGRVIANHLAAGGAALCATHQRLPLQRYQTLELKAEGAVRVAVERG